MEASHHPSVHISAFATNQEILLTLGTECDFLDDDNDDDDDYDRQMIDDRQMDRDT